MKKMLGVFLSVILIFTLSACQTSQNEEYTLKLGTALGKDDPIYQGLQEFSNNVEKKTNGKVKIQIFGNGSLGEDNDLIEQAKEGANIAVLSDSGRLSDMVSEMGVLTAPYIVDNYDDAKKVVQSKLFQGWTDQLQNQHNLDILSFNWYQGERHFITKKPIQKPEDLQGVKIRTMGSEVALQTMKSLGLSPSGLAWSEVYPALQQGVIDAAEAQYPAIWSAKLHEVNKHISKTRHFQLITGIVISKTWLDSLPENYQKIVRDEAFKAGDKASRETEKQLEEFEKKLQDAGVQVHEVDVAPFKEKTNQVYQQIKGYADLRDQINQILGKK